ncbi:13980_t:CDS:2, partial [Funneliformis caledonium]
PAVVIEVQVERAHVWQQPMTALSCKSDHYDCAWQQPARNISKQHPE